MFEDHRLQGIRGRHHIVVAYLALFVALGGSAVAAKPLIEGSDVQDESLTSADIQNDSLTGDDVLESSLGKVASATTADSATTAGDADTLDGKGSTDFLGANDKAADADQLDGKDSTQFLQSIQNVAGTAATAAAGRSTTARAECPAGSKLVGGGYDLTAGFIRTFHVYNNYPIGETWIVEANNAHADTDMSFRAVARCAS